MTCAVENACAPVIVSCSMSVVPVLAENQPRWWGTKKPRFDMLVGRLRSGIFVWSGCRTDVEPQISHMSTYTSRLLFPVCDPAQRHRQIESLIGCAPHCTSSTQFTRPVRAQVLRNQSIRAARDDHATVGRSNLQRVNVLCMLHLNPRRKKSPGLAKEVPEKSAINKLHRSTNMQ